MALVIPTASSLFPSAAWWQALANSINAETAQLRSEAIGASILTSGTDANTVTSSGTWTTWANSNPNTPETGTGILRTWWVTDTSGAQLWMSATNTASMYLRFRGSGGWSAWKRIDAQYAIDQAKAYTDTAVLGARGGSGSGTKVVPLALTVGGSAAASSLGAVGVRMPMQWGARVTRWRVHVRNINPRFGTNQPGAVSLTGLWFGQGDGSGSFTGAATQINGAVSTPADGSEWASKWVTTPLEAGTRYLLAYGLNTTGTQSVVGGGWTTASPADAANNAAAKTARTALPLDVWIEAETASTTPVIAAWGDSLSSGVGATLPVFDSVVSQYARANGALPVHYTASGDSAASWAGNLSAYKWTRWSTLAKPDVTIAAMGSNDVFNGDALATIQGNWQAAVDNIRATISPAVVVTTITPRDGVTGAQEDTRRSLNAWLKGLPKGRDVFDLVPAVSSDDETLTPALTSDGTHLNTAGYAAEVGTITRALAFAPTAGPQGPKGDKGDPGAPGGSDAATASWISSGTETQAALDNRAATTPAGFGAAANPAAYQVRVTSPAGSGRVALRVEQNDTGATDAMKIVNNAAAYALKIDHTANDKDAVNIAALGSGAYTVLGVGGANTSLSTVKITNSAAQVGGAVVFAQGTDTGRTAPIFTAENYGTGASFSAHAMNGAQSPAFRALFDAGFNHTARALWIDANHSGGSIIYVNNATAQTSGNMVSLTQADATSTAPVIQIVNNGTGNTIDANNFKVSQGGNVTCVALLNTSTFNNSRVQLTSLGTVVDRNVGDSAAALRINQAHASSTGDLVQLQAGGAVKARVTKAGSFATRNNAAPADADLVAGEAAWWFDSTNGAAKIMWKAKQADGAVKTGSVTLA